MKIINKAFIGELLATITAISVLLYFGYCGINAFSNGEIIKDIKDIFLCIGIYFSLNYVIEKIKALF